MDYEEKFRLGWTLAGAALLGVAFAHGHFERERTEAFGVCDTRPTSVGCKGHVAEVANCMSERGYESDIGAKDCGAEMGQGASNGGGELARS
jgi:hypothetical protein